MEARGRPSFSLVGAIAGVLLWAGIAASTAQQLPPGGGPIPPVRRGADGKIEVVPPGANLPSAAASPNAGARPAARRPDALGRQIQPTTLIPAVASTVGAHFSVSTDSLPAPNTTPPDDIDPIGVARPPGALPQATRGFSVSLFATGAGNARWLAVAPNGDVFMAASGNGKIMMLRDTKGKGVAVKGFRTPA